MNIQDNSGSGLLTSTSDAIAWRLFDNHTPDLEASWNSGRAPRYVADAMQWFYLSTYKDVDDYTDSEILLMNPEAALALYLDQFQIDVRQGECASDRDQHDCFRWTPSLYAKKILAAARAAGSYAPDPITYTSTCTSGTRSCIPAVNNWMCRSGEPDWERNTGGTQSGQRQPGQGNMSDGWILRQIALDLAGRIYKLRTDLHFVVDPNTGEKVIGLPDLNTKMAKLIGCTGEKQWQDWVGEIAITVFGTIIPGAGWAMLAGEIHMAVVNYLEAKKNAEEIEDLLTNTPKGIQNILGRKRLEQTLFTYDEVKHLSADPDALKLAQSMGIPHPAMVCTELTGCDVTMQMLRLKDILNEWNTYRLIARRAEYDRWRRAIIRQQTPSANTADWKVFYNMASGETSLNRYWGSCMRSQSSNAGLDQLCKEADSKYRAWTQQVDAIIAAGPVPPEPYTFWIYKPEAYGAGAYVMPGNWESHYGQYASNFSWKSAYSQGVLDRTDEILVETNWFDPQHINSENLMQYVQQVVGLPPIIDQIVPPDPILDISGSTGNLTEVFSHDFVEQAQDSPDPASAAVSGVNWPVIIGLSLLFL